ncbi:MAG TPA: caspase family protein [Sphaerochaeta sp.]|nr:caspase family protein [Sphaerochaeta sp.]
MKRYLLVLLAVSLLFLASCEFFTEEPIEGNVYYINVGLDYQNSTIRDLQGTINDAEELHEALEAIITRAKRTGVGYKMIQRGNSAEDLLDTNYPSQGKIQSRLAEVKGLANENDLTIFTFSGHGEATTGRLVLAYSDGQNFRLAPEELLTWMADIPGKKLVILDSCYSGMFVDKSASSTNTVLNNSIAKFFETYYSSDPYKKPDLFVLTASAHTDSYETNFVSKSNHNHGFFTYALLEALGWSHPHEVAITTVETKDPPAAENGRITVDGLFKYILKNQAINSRFILFSPQREFQHPIVTGGPLDLILFNL